MYLSTKSLKISISSVKYFSISCFGTKVLSRSS
jgi:hypothetical protein